MKISFETKAGKADILVVFAKEGLKWSETAAQADKKSGHALSRTAKAEGFDGKKHQLLTIAAPANLPYSHVIVAGLGKASTMTLLDYEKLGSSLVPALNAKKAASAVFDLSDAMEAKGEKAEDAAARMALGALLTTYRFDKYLTKEPKDKKPTLKTIQVVSAHAAAAKKVFAAARAVASGVFLTRDLVSEVPNVLYPESFAAIIKKELSPLGIKVEVLDVKAMDKLGMNCLLGVGQGSARPPRLVTMQWKNGKANAKTLALVGKGVTFDTGGISLKPGAGMEDMKWDMAGAGAVVGAMKALALRNAKANVVGVVALAENMPSGNASRPGDIVTSMSGQTVENLNTDAEGRLILCDALWYTQEKFKPSHIVDLATLTGAVIIALGHEYAGAFSNDDAFAQTLRKSGNDVGELLWQLPMNDAWDKAIDSPAADMKNISGGRDAGSAIGAHFLKRFIKDGVTWAHLDIAGTAWSGKDRTSVPKGASAFGVRLLDNYVAQNWE